MKAYLADTQHDLLVCQGVTIFLGRTKKIAART